MMHLSPGPMHTPGTAAHLHAVGEHDTHGHELGEDTQQLRVGQHAVLEARVQEARVVTQHVINVAGLWGEGWGSMRLLSEPEPAL